MMKKLITMIICLAIVSGVSAQEKRNDFDKRGQSEFACFAERRNCRMQSNDFDKRGQSEFACFAERRNCRMQSNDFDKREHSEFTSSSESRNYRIKSNDKKKFTIGAKAGLNVATFVGTNTKNLHKSIKINMGFHIGVVAELYASNGFAFAPEILFSTQGFRTDMDVVGDMGSVNANYITIPLMARFYIINCLSLDAGPYCGFATSIKIKDDGETVTVGTDEYNVFDYGLCLGMTYNLRQKFFASARYNIGISDVVKHLNNTNSVFQLSLGYNFFLR